MDETIQLPDLPGVSAAHVAATYGFSMGVSRCIAGWVDLAVLWGIVLIPDAVLGNAFYRRTLAVWIGTQLLYFLVAERLWGKSLGKLVSRLSVVDEYGGKPSWRQVVIRTVLRILEVNPFMLNGLPAVIAAMGSKSHQRLGDMAARTYVIRDEDLHRIELRRPPRA